MSEKKTKKQLPASKKLQELKLKENPKLKKIRDLPPDVLAGAIRDLLNRDKR